MSESRSADMPAALRIAVGTDRFGESRGHGISIVSMWEAEQGGRVPHRAKGPCCGDPLLHARS